MPTYILTYDLHEGADYEPLILTIKRYGTWARLTESTWLIVAEGDSEAIRNSLLPLVSAKDRLAVIKSGGEGAWHNVMCGSDWLKKYL